MAEAVLLVHGAWHGAWCWERVTFELKDRGLRVDAVDLPGHGSDRTPLTDLHGDATRVREALTELGEPAVLVGHSYGGAVISEAGDHPLAEGLVFLPAFPLDVGETGEMRENPPDREHGGGRSLDWPRGSAGE